RLGSEGLLKKSIDDVGGLIWTASPVVKNRDEEARLIRHVEMLSQKYIVEPVYKGFVATREFDEFANVMRSIERIGPQVAFIEEVRPGTAHKHIRRGPASV